MINKSQKSRRPVGFIVSKKQWYSLTGRPTIKFRSCFPISMDRMGMFWEYCCNRCLDWDIKCCLKCGHNQGCNDSPYATKRRAPRPISEKVRIGRGLSLS